MEAVAQNDRAFRPTYLYRLVCEMCVPVCMYWLAGRVRMESFLTNYVCAITCRVTRRDRRGNEKNEGKKKMRDAAGLYFCDMARATCTSVGFSLGITPPLTPRVALFTGTA